MEGNTLMDARIKQLVLEMLRMGEDPEQITTSLIQASKLLHDVKGYVPNHDMADFYRAYKDADFRP
jgi:hypothetical protein